MELGVEAGNIYNHIGSKSEVLQAIYLEAGNEFTVQNGTIKNSLLSILGETEAVIRFLIQAMGQNFEKGHAANHK